MNWLDPQDVKMEREKWEATAPLHGSRLLAFQEEVAFRVLQAIAELEPVQVLDNSECIYRVARIVTWKDT